MASESDKVTSSPDTDLIQTGQRLRTGYLLQQASVTIGMAKTEGPAMENILPPGHIPKVVSLRDGVAAAGDSKTIVTADAKLATGTQHTATRAVKSWGRKGTSRSSAAIRAGVKLPDEMTHAITGSIVPEVLAQGRQLLTLLGEHAPAMDAVGAPTQPLIDEGRAVCDALETADSAQELSRASALPVALADFYIKKAQLYTGLQIINDAGHELYAHDPQASGRFNLSILYRHHAAGNTAPVPTPPEPPAQKPPTP